MVRIIKLEEKLTEEEMAKREGELFNSDYYDEIINEDCDAYDNNGNILFKLRKAVIDPMLTQLAVDNYKKAAQKKHENRGASAGPLDKEKMPNYIGDFVEGQQKGLGEKIFINGNIYKGEFVDGYFNGAGKYVDIKSNIYEGNFKNGNFEGLGNMIYGNGDTYQGSWKEGKRDGTGIWLSVEDGFSYEGDWKSGMPDGVGVMIYKNGTKEKGNFLDGKLVKLIN